MKSSCNLTDAECDLLEKVRALPAVCLHFELAPAPSQKFQTICKRSETDLLAKYLLKQSKFDKEHELSIEEFTGLLSIMYEAIGTYLDDEQVAAP